MLETAHCETLQPKIHYFVSEKENSRRQLPHTIIACSPFFCRMWKILENLEMTFQIHKISMKGEEFIIQKRHCCFVKVFFSRFLLVGQYEMIIFAIFILPFFAIPVFFNFFFKELQIPYFLTYFLPLNSFLPWIVFAAKIQFIK